MKQRHRKLQVFTEKEIRWDYYPMFLKLMENGFEIEAYMFILSTWNFARFRYVMRNFDLDAFTYAIQKLTPYFKKMEKEDFEIMDLDKYANDVKHMFKTLADIKGIEATGTPKLMHIRLPKVFVMWDSYIRKAYGYDKGDAADYLAFLKHMQREFANIKVNSGRTLAKLIDEHNYRKFTMPALEKARNKRSKVN